MKTEELINFLTAYPKDAEVEIEIYETTSGRYVDTTADITSEKQSRKKMQKVVK